MRRHFGGILRPISKHLPAIRVAAEIISRSPASGLRLLLDSRSVPQIHAQPDVYPFAAYPGPAVDEILLRLDDPAFARKISAAQGYRELAGEVLNAFGRTSANAFAVERMRPVDPNADIGPGEERPPFNEQYGEKQVAAGHYTRVLRYHEHIAPLAAALRTYAAQVQKSRRA